MLKDSKKKGNILFGVHAKWVQFGKGIVAVLPIYSHVDKTSKYLAPASILKFLYISVTVFRNVLVTSYLTSYCPYVLSM